MIKKMTIKLTTPEDVTEFVKKASSISGDVNVYRGKFAVDGTSLLAMMCLNLSQPLIAEYPAKAKDFENFILQFKAE